MEFILKLCLLFIMNFGNVETQFILKYKLHQKQYVTMFGLKQLLFDNNTLEIFLQLQSVYILSLFRRKKCNI